MSTPEHGSNPLTFDGNLCQTEVSSVVPEFDLGIVQQGPVEAGWDVTVRNRNLRLLCEGLTSLEATRHAVVERQHGHGNDRDVLRLERKLTRGLAKACGSCGLRDSCDLAYNLTDWYDAHSSEDRDQYGVESRNSMLQRIKTDPYAYCGFSPRS